MHTVFRLICVLAAAAIFLPPAHAGEAKAPVFALPLDAMQASANNKNQRLYVKPGVDLKQYHSVIIEPLVFTHHQPDGQWQIVLIEEQSRIAQYFQHSLAAALLAENITVATDPGPGIARLRVAISDILQERPGLSVTDLVPVKAIFNIARKAGGAEPYLVKMATMAQLEDSTNHDVIAGSINLVDSQKTKTSKQPITKEWIKDAIDRWNKDGAKLLARRMAPVTTLTAPRPLVITPGVKGVQPPAQSEYQP